MALACSHAYIPSLSSESMSDAIKANPTKFTTLFGIDVKETSATESALDLILSQVAHNAPTLDQDID
jgi:hypothetical protein